MASRRQKTIAVVRAQNRPVSAQPEPLLHVLKNYFLSASGALISIKRPSVDLQPNAA
jgi:hypothetical protein